MSTEMIQQKHAELMGFNSWLEYLNQNGRIVWSLDDYSSDGIPDGMYKFKTDSWQQEVTGHVMIGKGEFQFETLSNQFPVDYKQTCNHWYIEDFKLNDDGIIEFMMGS